MKICISILFVFTSLTILGQDLININGNKYYILNSDKIDESENVVFFLHGGLKNPIFKSSEFISLDYLIENNYNFLEFVKGLNAVVVLPIVNDSLNWLHRSAYCHYAFLHINQTLGNKKVTISGFSDGGTGAYRIFYSFPQYYEGLVVFNGYPQLQSFNRKIDYSAIDNKKIFFLSSYRDKVIPYEFLLTEYVNQKKHNSETFFKVVKGAHSFRIYGLDDLKLIEYVFKKDKDEYLNSDIIHGLIINNKLKEFYKFRRRITRRFAFGLEYFNENKRQRKKIKND